MAAGIAGCDYVTGGIAGSVCVGRFRFRGELRVRHRKGFGQPIPSQPHLYGAVVFGAGQLPDPPQLVGSEPVAGQNTEVHVVAP